MRETDSERRIDASEVASVIFYALISIFVAFLIVCILYIIVMAIIFPSTRFSGNSALPPIGLTGLFLVLLAGRLWSKFPTLNEFIEQSGRLIKKVWYPLLATLCASIILNLLALSVLEGQ